MIYGPIGRKIAAVRDSAKNDPSTFPAWLSKQTDLDLLALIESGPFGASCTTQQAINEVRATWWDTPVAVCAAWWDILVEEEE